MFTSCLVLPKWILIWNLLQWDGKVFFGPLLFFNTICTNDKSAKHIFNTLFANLHCIYVLLNLNSIQFKNPNSIQCKNLNWIQWNLNSIQCISIQFMKIKFQFDSSCMQCHSLFIIKFNLIFTKINSLIFSSFHCHCNV